VEFEKLALEHLDAVHRMALHLTHNAADAADLVQDTYVRALKAAPRFQEQGGGIRAWLFTILHNTFYTRMKRERMAPMAVGEFFAERANTAPPGEPTPAWDLKTFDWEYVDERLKAAIDGLDPEHRLMLLLWGVEGMKYREIAAIVDVPIGTVMSRLHRARKQVVKSLGDAAADLGVQAAETSNE